MRAALNFAFKNGKVHSDNAWRRVPAFKDADTARIRYLTVADCQRLIKASDPELRLLVQAALQTRARYAELARLMVEDFKPDSGTLLIRQSKSGKSPLLLGAKVVTSYLAELSQMVLKIAA